MWPWLAAIMILEFDFHFNNLPQIEAPHSSSSDYHQQQAFLLFSEMSD